MKYWQHEVIQFFSYIGVFIVLVSNHVDPFVTLVVNALMVVYGISHYRQARNFYLTMFDEFIEDLKKAVADEHEHLRHDT